MVIMPQSQLTVVNSSFTQWSMPNLKSSQSLNDEITLRESLPLRKRVEFYLERFRVYFKKYREDGVLELSHTCDVINP